MTTHASTDNSVNSRFSSLSHEVANLKRTLSSKTPLRLQRWGLLAPILLLAFWLRAGYMCSICYGPDLAYFSSWMHIVGRYGLLDFYNHRNPYELIYAPVASSVS